jgi:hypothetical protein
MGAKVVLPMAIAIAVGGVQTAQAGPGLFGGIDVRTDLGTQFVRAGAALDLGRLSFDAVVDPYGYRSGEQHDTELLAGWALWPDGWSLMGGWRVSSLPLLGTRYYQEKALVGVAAPLSPLGSRHLRARIGVEWAVTLARHGGDLPTFWLWQEDELHGGAFNLGLVLRLEAGGTL